MTSRIVREYIRSVLNEEDYGNIGAGGYGSYGYGDNMAGYGGMGGWGGKSILGIVTNPIADVAKTAMGSGKEVAAQAKGLVKTTFEAAISFVIPFVSGEYDKIAKETHEEVTKIKKQYEGVYKNNLDAIFNLDLVTLAFFLNPSAVITGEIFHKLMYSAPEAALSILGFFVPVSGMKMWNSLMRVIHPEKIQRILKTASGGDSKTKLIVWDDRNRRKLYSNVRRAMGIEHDAADPATGSYKESIQKQSIMVESDDAANSYQEVVKSILSDPAIQSAMKNSQSAQKLREEAKKIISKKLMETFELAKKLTSAPTFNVLGGAIGKNDMKGTDAELEKVKSAIREMLSKKLSEELSSAEKKGVDQTKSGIGAVYEKIIGQINNLPVNTGASHSKVSPPQGELKNGSEKPQGISGNDGGGKIPGRDVSNKNNH